MHELTHRTPRAPRGSSSHRLPERGSLLVLEPQRAGSTTYTVFVSDHLEDGRRRAGFSRAPGDEPALGGLEWRAPAGGPHDLFLHFVFLGEVVQLERCPAPGAGRDPEGPEVLLSGVHEHTQDMAVRARAGAVRFQVHFKCSPQPDEPVVLVTVRP